MSDKSQCFQVRARQDVQAVFDAKSDVQWEQKIKSVDRVGINPTSLPVAPAFNKSSREYGESRKQTTRIVKHFCTY
jgi:hypothetical protein